MDTSNILALIAISISAFTLYWTTFRDTKKLIYVPIETHTGIYAPQFALVNAGNREVLVTSIKIKFLQKGDDWSGTSFSNVTINDGETIFRIPPGKSHVCISKFPQRFRTEFLKEEEFFPHDNEEICHKEVQAVIYGTDSKGNRFEIGVPIARYGINREGEIKMKIGYGKSLNIFKDKCLAIQVKGAV